MALFGKMRHAVAAAPDVMVTARQLEARAQELAAAQRAASAAGASSGAADLPTAPAVAKADLAPIGGMSIEQYASVSRILRAAEPGEAPDPARIAAELGVSAESWAAAVDGWNTRIVRAPGVARRFNDLCLGREDAAPVASGVNARAVVVAASQTGTLVNDQPMVRLELTVVPAGASAYAVTVTQVVELLHLAKASVGRALPVRVDPARPDTVWIDWAAA